MVKLYQRFFLELALRNTFEKRWSRRCRNSVDIDEKGLIIASFFPFEVSYDDQANDSELYAHWTFGQTKKNIPAKHLLAHNTTTNRDEVTCVTCASMQLMNKLAGQNS
jgi:hypothetical protein